MRGKRKNRKRVIGLLAAAILLLGSGTLLFAAGEGMQASTGLLEVSGKIAAVNPDQRTLALREKWFGFLPTGRTKDVIVDRSAEISDANVEHRLQLNDLRPGDEVTIRYSADSGANVAQAIIVRRLAEREEALPSTAPGAAPMAGAGEPATEAQPTTP